MVKTKKEKIIFSDNWKDIRIKKATAKDLMLFKINNNFITYDQAIEFLLKEAQ
jgi:hypothetical protein